MATTKLEQEVVKATGVKAKKGEKRQAFLVRLVKGIDGLSDEALAELSEEAQAWNDAAITAAQAKDDIAEFSEFEGKEVPVTETTPSKADKAAKADATTHTPPAKAKKDKAPAEAKEPKGPSAVMRVKQALCEDASLKKDDLRKMLDAEGLHLTDVSLQTARADFLGAVRVLQEAGMLKKKMLD